MSHDILATVSWAADTLSRDPRQLFHVVRVLLTDLRHATRMDSAELYLADPQQSSLLLSGYSGEDREAFAERSVFRFGEGFPGLAAQSRQGLETQHLASDRRYLRPRVPALGYQVFLSTPMLLPHATVGVLTLAARDAAPMNAAQRHLSLVAPLLAASLYAVMTSLGERTLDRVRQARTTRDRVLALLEDTLESTSAVRATLRLDGQPAFDTHPGQGPACAGQANCLAMTGQLRVSGIQDLSCPAFLDGASTVCLPVWEEQAVRGVTTLQFGSDSGHGESVAPLLWMGRLTSGTLGLGSGAAEPAAPWLDIETFGAFRVHRDGKVLDPKAFKRRQAYQLLKVLVTRLGQATHTDELCEALWPGEPVDDRVRARLHVTVSALRTVVEPEGADGPQIIVRDGLAYRFQPGPLARTDAQQFETLVRLGDTQSGMDALQTYARALHLYQGDFMGDDPYADSFALERDYLRELAIRSLFRAAELHEAGGRTQEALTAYSHILTIDPLRFEAHEALIGCLVQQERLEDAQARWERYARAFGSRPPLPPPLPTFGGGTRA